MVSLLGSSSLGTLLGTEANAHNAADDAADDGAAGEHDANDDKDNDTGGETSGLLGAPLSALVAHAEVGLAGNGTLRAAAALALAPFAPSVVVAHFVF